MNISNNSNHRRFTLHNLSRLLGLFSLILLLSSQAQAQQSLNKVVAIVDDGVILQSEFEERMALARQQIAAGNVPNLPPQQLRQEVLDQLILERLQLQAAARAGIRVDDNTLNQALTTIASQNNMTFDQFRQMLESQNSYLQTREQIRNEIMLNQVQNGAVNSRINITRQEIENYLRSESGQATIAPEYHIAHILIAAPVPTQRHHELAELVHEQVSEGRDIMEIATARQMLGMELSGGDLGWRKREALPTVFRDIVPGLQAGEISEPFTSPSGIHLVQLLETRGGAELQVDQTRVRHIMITPNEIRTPEDARILAESLHGRILAGEDFGNIARQHTDDPNTMVSGGDLGWVSRGQLPPEFMAVIDQAEIGELTEPFPVGSAWHIAEVLDRRVQDVTEENKRFRAEQVLRERKYENELENWLTELRDTAYIDIKI